MKKELKECGICKMVILIPGEDYAKLEQFDKQNKLLNIGHYHVTCYREKILMQNNLVGMQKKAMDLLNKAQERLA